jgi:hypothetical protein
VTLLSWLRFMAASVVCAIFSPLIADPNVSVITDRNRGLRFWCYTSSKSRP